MDLIAGTIKTIFFFFGVGGVEEAAPISLATRLGGARGLLFKVIQYIQIVPI